MCVCSQRSLEVLEGEHSELRRDLVTLREALGHVTLQKEVLQEIGRAHV